MSRYQQVNKDKEVTMVDIEKGDFLASHLSVTEHVEWLLTEMI